MWENIKIGCMYAVLLVMLMLLLSFLSAWVFMLLWNWIIPDLFGLAELPYWKAFGICWMCTILFKAVNIQWK